MRHLIYGGFFRPAADRDPVCRDHKSRSVGSSLAVNEDRGLFLVRNYFQKFYYIIFLDAPCLQVDMFIPDLGITDYVLI